MIKVSRSQAIFIWAPSVIMLVLVAAASLLFDVNISQLTRDVAAIAGVHPMSGLLSNLGILLWCTAAALCFFTGVLLKDTSEKHVVYFLYSSALLSLYLLIDDFFMIHELLALKLAGLGEKAIYYMLAVAVSVYLLAFRKIIFKTKAVLLALAFVFLGASVLFDSILEPWLSAIGDWQFFLEDGAKWVGIVCWCNYYAVTCYQFAVNAISQTEHPTHSALDV